MTTWQKYHDMCAEAAADRARFGSPQTLIAEFSRNACEKITIERSGPLVRISTRHPDPSVAEMFEACFYECHVDHLPKLIEALTRAISSEPCGAVSKLN